MKQYVSYTVNGKDYQAGPFPAKDADWERDDIASYAGVTCVFLTAHRDEKRKLIHADFTANNAVKHRRAK